MRQQHTLENVRSKFVRYRKSVNYREIRTPKLKKPLIGQKWCLCKDFHFITFRLRLHKLSCLFEEYYFVSGKPLNERGLPCNLMIRDSKKIIFHAQLILYPGLYNKQSKADGFVRYKMYHRIVST